MWHCPLCDLYSFQPVMVCSPEYITNLLRTHCMWWLWLRQWAMFWNLQCDTFQSGMLQAKLRYLTLWTQTSNRKDGQIRTLRRCSLTDTVILTDYMLIPPSYNHMRPHKSQWPTNLRIPAVLHCALAHCMVLLLTLRSLHRCQVHFMETWLLFSPHIQVFVTVLTVYLTEPHTVIILFEGS